MSRRPGFTVTRQLAVEPLPSPDSFRPVVTCQLTMHFPPNVSEHALVDVLADVVAESMAELARAYAAAQTMPRNTWLAEP